MISDGAASYLTLLLNEKFLELHIFDNSCILFYYYIVKPPSGPISLSTMPCFSIVSLYLNSTNSITPCGVGTPGL